MTVHVLPVPTRLTMVHKQDPDLIEAVRRAKRRVCSGESIDGRPGFDLSNVVVFKRPKGSILFRWRRDDEKPLFTRMVEARDA